ncbi:MAG: hypothetical protein D6748_14400 [Calditrichaeota bacterium]|nr:MAG: hypothetical protein D6748_14400 [Calditrichota bacterium]
MSVGTDIDDDYYAAYTYNPDGSIANETLNNGGAVPIIRTYSYNSPGWLTNLDSDFGNDYFHESIDYTSGGYGGGGYYNGNIAKTTFSYSWNGAPAGYSVQYQYDNLNQLQAADHSISALANFDIGVGAGNETIYDANGNILQMTVGSNTKNYTYYTGTNKVQNTDGAGNDYTYDANGNIIKSVPKTLNSLSYDPFTQMTTDIVTDANETISLQYGGEHQRVLKTFDTQTDVANTLYLHGMNDYPLMEKNQFNGGSESRVVYFYGLTGLLAMQKDGAVYYVLKDHLGSTRVLVDGSGTVAAYYDYSPIGNLMRFDETAGIVYRFTGQEFDSESGLHNYRARLYDSDLGRFYAMDVAWQFASPFAYAGNNPVVYVDEDGRIAWFVPILIGAAFNTIMNVPHIQDVGDFFAFAGIGALGGALSMVGNPGAWYGLQNVLVGALEGGVTGGLNSLAQGGKFWRGFKSGAIIGGAFGVVTSEQFGNFTRGQGWRSNDQVLNRILLEGEFEPEAYQEALEYFGFEGEFNPEYYGFEINPDAFAATDPVSGITYYNYPAFSNYSNLRATYMHEVVIHGRQFREGRLLSNLDELSPERGVLEHEAYWFQYKNQGLFPGHNYNLISNIRYYGMQGGIYWIGASGGVTGQNFYEKWYHFIYKLPRRFGMF